MRYELSDYEWAALRPFLPNKPRGVPRVNDRRVLNGIFWVLRSGAPWRDLPETFGPYTTCYNRFVRWGRAGVWDEIMDALAATHDAAVQMIDTSVVRVHRLLILWGTRSGETARLQRTWVEDGNMTVPGEFTKNGRAHTIPLLPMARAILRDQQSNRVYYFPGRLLDDTHFNDGSWSKLKREVDHALPRC
jgi:transposase